MLPESPGETLHNLGREMATSLDTPGMKASFGIG